MTRTLFAFALTLAFAAPAALANDAARNLEATSSPSSSATEFDMEVAPGVNVQSSETGRLFAVDVAPFINVGENRNRVFVFDLAPGLNRSRPTQGLFDINPHVNVR